MRRFGKRDALDEPDPLPDVEPELLLPVEPELLPDVEPEALPLDEPEPLLEPDWLPLADPEPLELPLEELSGGSGSPEARRFEIDRSDIARSLPAATCSTTETAGVSLHCSATAG